MQTLLTRPATADQTIAAGLDRLLSDLAVFDLVLNAEDQTPLAPVLPFPAR